MSGPYEEARWCGGAVWSKKRKLASQCDLVSLLFFLRGDLDLPVREGALFGDRIGLLQPVLVGSLSLG